MIQDFHIVHRRKPQFFADTPGYPVWSTCLRSLAFTRPDFPLALGDEAFAQADAYRFLLEVACGLHSPIVGETEVFGQFKVFSQEWVKADPSRASLVQRILNDTKAIRSQYLSHLGTQSYGSWVRKNLKSKRVHILGGGLLAREILPYLLKQKRDVVLHVRDSAKVDFYSGAVHKLQDEGFDHGAVIVAAPLSAAEIARFLGPKSALQVFDLRDTSLTDPLTVDTGLFDLGEIFAQIAQTKIDLKPRLEQVQREIARRSDLVMEHSLLRPQGWDDLCA